MRCRRSWRPDAHDEAEALTKDAFNALERHLLSITGVGVEHGQRFTGVEHETDGMEIPTSEEEVVANGRVVARVVATQHLAGEGEASTADGNGEHQSQPSPSGRGNRQEMEVLDGTDKPSLVSVRGAIRPTASMNFSCASSSLNSDVCPCLKAVRACQPVLFKPRKDRAEFGVAVVGDVDELRGHAGIDVHLE